MSLYLPPASRRKAWRIASTLTMGMPQIAASTALRSKVRRASASAERFESFWLMAASATFRSGFGHLRATWNVVERGARRNERLAPHAGREFLQDLSEVDGRPGVHVREIEGLALLRIDDQVEKVRRGELLDRIGEGLLHVEH